MDKSLLLKSIIEALETVHQGAIKAAMVAYASATDEENKAENKYDTLGLEASYLAQGQNQRESECAADVVAYKALSPVTFNDETPIAIGALIQLEDTNANLQTLFLGPGAGGMKLDFENTDITLITPSAPLGKALLGQYEGDEIEIQIAGDKSIYAVLNVQ